VIDEVKPNLEAFLQKTGNQVESFYINVIFFIL